MFSLLAALVVQLRHVVANCRDLLLENAALCQQLAAISRRACRSLTPSKPAASTADRRPPSTRISTSMRRSSFAFKSSPPSPIGGHIHSAVSPDVFSRQRQSSSLALYY
jgi:hypothetical protein